MNANLTDSQFQNTPGAIYVTGVFGEPHMDQFTGVGHSSTPYKMKAVMIDGTVYIPSPSYARKFYKRERDYSNYPMVRARIQPPMRAIQSA